MNKLNIKIESGVPFSGKQLSGFSKKLKAMKVGQSFLLPKKKRWNLSLYAGRAGVQVMSRSVNATHVRVWRTA